jgi:hypothetical protein
MAKRASKRNPTAGRARPSGPSPVARPPVARPAGVSSGVVRLVQNSILTALAGMRDVGSEVGHVAVSAVRGSIRAAGEIGADVGRLALDVAEGAIDAADRLTAAVGRAANNLVEPNLSGPSVAHRRAPQSDPGRGPRPDPDPRPDLRTAGSPREASALPGDLPANLDAYARRPASRQAAPRRKPLSPSPSREQRDAAARRRKGDRG